MKLTEQRLRELIKEEILLINEAKSWAISEDDVKNAATKLAKAMTNVDKVKVEMHDFEYDKGRGAGFDLSWDGNKHDGGSYYIDANGNVINAAVNGGVKYGTIKSSVRDFEKGIRSMEKYRNISVKEKTSVILDKQDGI